ncbi:hypothetical protein MesoLjLc_50460 [Mesorhizobium sp. L-8-10]|uniref:hypothetical protein n=1 Tax=Mesorhizobium sp. L-8-10 TaxID=2744523 RepID=UPI0019358FCD|nr:hypothetical protein [Mesorhizobium sp. L-8-10]BCH33116.1 hypothetical protein MesoLjLc_50460 [Mesorhizobium sp. L-8-10]
MAQKTIGIGSAPNDGTGDPLRTAFGKVNDNFTELYVWRMTIAVSDETTELTVGTAKVTFRMPCAITLTEVRASLTVASDSGGSVVVDINESGSSILSTKLSIDALEKTSTTAATPAVISDANLADDAEMTIDLDQVGTGAAGLKVTLIGTLA